MSETTILKLPSSPNSVSQLEHFLRKVINEHRVCESKFSDILVSLTEAVNNAIIHGNQNDVKKKVMVKCKTSNRGLQFSIVDEGKGFNPEAIPDPTSAEKLETCGGRGVFIINALADKVAIKSNGSTNTVEIYFKAR